MSINLHVEGYCENCPEFTACTYSNALETVDGGIYVHDIYCEHRDQCSAIMDHLKKYPLLYKDLNLPKEKDVNE
jgi:hypothetical protein